MHDVSPGTAPRPPECAPRAFPVQNEASGAPRSGEASLPSARVEHALSSRTTPDEPLSSSDSSPKQARSNPRPLTPGERGSNPHAPPREHPAPAPTKKPMRPHPEGGARMGSHGETPALGPTQTRIGMTTAVNVRSPGACSTPGLCSSPSSKLTSSVSVTASTSIR